VTSTWLDDRDPEPVSVSLPAAPHFAGPYACGCPPTDGASCDVCDGVKAERDALWRLPRALRERLSLAERRLDPSWRALHGVDEGQAAADRNYETVQDEVEAHLARREQQRRAA